VRPVATYWTGRAGVGNRVQGVQTFYCGLTFNYLIWDQRHSESHTEPCTPCTRSQIFKLSTLSATFTEK
jgi:hypothetical protein